MVYDKLFNTDYDKIRLLNNCYEERLINRGNICKQRGNWYRKDDSKVQSVGLKIKTERRKTPRVSIGGYIVHDINRSAVKL